MGRPMLSMVNRGLTPSMSLVSIVAATRLMAEPDADVVVEGGVDDDISPPCRYKKREVRERNLALLSNEMSVSRAR